VWSVIHRRDERLGRTEETAGLGARADGLDPAAHRAGDWRPSRDGERVPEGAARGAIVNTASVGGLLPEADRGAYVAAKHGMIGLTKTAAIEKAHLGIRVNALAPGWVRTGLTRSLEDEKELCEKLKEASPMHRGAEPEEMVGMVLFLCSDAASYATGQTFVVDGGQMIRGLVPVQN
jgi:NAD(P)-dependent dehydrogenase (short-subunit alcohol dehydrogenase family)